MLSRDSAEMLVLAITLVGGLMLLCLVLLAYRLITMLVSDKPYWGGSVTEGNVDKAKQPATHAFYVSVTALGLAAAVGMVSLLLWSFLHR
jgi:hypothetical protein